MGGQAHGAEVVQQQAERAPGIDDHQARPVDGHHHHRQVVQRGRFAGAGRPEHQHMGVLLAIMLVQRVDPDGLAAPVPEPEARMVGAACPPIDRQQRCDLRGEGQARAAQGAVVEGRIEVERQAAHEAVQRHQILARMDKAQAGGHQQGIRLGYRRLQGFAVRPGHVQRDHHRKQLVALDHAVQHQLAFAVCLHGQGIARTRGIPDALDMALQLVLRLHRDRDRQHGAGRQAVKAGEGLVAALQLRREMPDLRR